MTAQDTPYAVDQRESTIISRKIALIECEDAAKWKGYTESLWTEALREPGDQWQLYKAYEGELPTPSEAREFDWILIAGSHCSAYEEHAWIHQMLELLPQYAAQGTRMYGCCFGSQILARALGGSVGKNPDGNFVLTLEQIQPTPQLQQFNDLHQVVQQALAQACRTDSQAAADNDSIARALQSAAATANEGTAGADDLVDGLQEMRLACSSGCFRLIESHGDQVLELPPGATRLATSATAVNELWCYGPNVLASQFHVEFDEPLVLEKIWAALQAVGTLSEQQAKESRRILEAGGQQNASILEVIKHFLRHGIKDAPSVSSSGRDVPSTDHTGGSGTDPSSKGNASSNSAGNNSSNPSNSNAGSGNSSGTRFIDASRDCIDQQQHASCTNSSSTLHTDAAGNQSAANCQSSELPDTAAGASSSASASVADPIMQQLSQQTRTYAVVEGRKEHQPSSTSNDSSGGGSGGALAHIQTVPLTALVLAVDAVPPLVSGASSPTAASEYSITTATSASSAVPFSHIAQQRRQQAREEGLQEASQRLLIDAAAAFTLRMQAYNLDLETLQQMNDVAAERYGSTAEVATALGQFSADLETRQAAVREALAVLPQLDRQLKTLEGAVGQLDKRSKELETKLGLGKSSTYDYLASTFSRAGSSVTAAAQYAASGGACLGGDAMVKQ